MEGKAGKSKGSLCEARHRIQEAKGNKPREKWNIEDSDF